MKNITTHAVGQPRKPPGRLPESDASHCYKVGVPRGANRQISLGLSPELLQGIDGLARAQNCSRVDVIRNGLIKAYGADLAFFAKLV